ncbi:murein hydrolase activator EnvC family protein [Helicobacter sp. 23-1044]
MRLLLIFFLAIALFGDTNKNIKTNEKKLENIASKADSINAKLKSLGANINDKNAKIKELERQINALNKNISENQKSFEAQERVFKETNERQNALNSRLNALQQEFIDRVLREVAIIMMLNQKEALSEDAIISEEVLKHLSASARADIEVILKEQERVKVDLDSAKIRIDNAKKVINSQLKKREILQLAINEQKNLIKKMNSELGNYDDELKRLDKERVGIQKILVDLNILKKKELQEQEKKRKALLAKKADSAKNAESKQKSSALPIAPLEVRQIGSSYRNVSTAKYNGTKTIAPLKNYKILTKYGPYFDPVYKMRVFNEFVTFGVNTRSAVQSVMDGKVVFAKSTPVLKKVVIIEHRNGIHTIYSYLDEIPRNISVNTRIKKGDTIAFVSEKLHFEVTQKDKHIDPLQLIKVK